MQKKFVVSRNLSEQLSIDVISLSHGELYTKQAKKLAGKEFDIYFG
jgi:hypothetical protein